MVSPQLLEILRCPETRQRLSPADEATLARLNAAIQARQLRNHGGDTLEKPLEGGLVREDGQALYPIVEQIPVMLIDESIRLDAS